MRGPISILVALAGLLSMQLGPVRAASAEDSSGFRRLAIDSPIDFFVWTDTCNVYVLREGETALLIDLGDGSVLDHLSQIGVKNVEWVLFTHHHREQSQGASRLKR